MSVTIVSTAERPEFVSVTARWRYDAFYEDSGESFDAVLARAQQTADRAQPMPRTLVLLVDGAPVGTASLTAHDLDERPDLTPWLAGVYVAPDARGQGYAGLLVAAVEQAAAAMGISTLWLYTNTAERIYARAGWKAVEVIQHKGTPVVLMRRDLQACSVSAAEIPTSGPGLREGGSDSL
ncbi:GNAT family N-acetyltransferase [Roseomonas elaeocarpi]|uniref:GNAT family N-acetyltransferase n=1 Tax=Roseomonas elaeocarpi TaxID=907779 RepID=A0ABV6JNR0_9PROT